MWRPRRGIARQGARRGWLAVPRLALFALACAVPAAADEFSRTYHYSARLFSGGTLVIDTRVGDIWIEAWDEPSVSVEAEKVVRAKSEAKAAPWYDRIAIKLEGRDKEVRLTTVYPGRSLWNPFHGESRLSVNFHIRMPYDANLVLKCVDGDVRIWGVTGQEQLRVNYGDVEINVPDVWRLRLLDAHTWMGYVESDLSGLDQDGAGFRQRVSFYNERGDQEIRVRVRMGGIWIYGDEP